MYAVISASGKQYRVKKGDTIQLDLLDQKIGETVSFTEVLLAGEGSGVLIGRPFLDKALVKAEILGVEKGPKIEIVNYKRRKQYKRHVGHRQPFTRVLITEVNSGSASDVLSKDERNALMKRVGFSLKNEYDMGELDQAAQEKKATQLKAKAEKKKAKASAPAKAAAPKKAAAKKTSAKKAPAKKAAKKDE